MMKGVVLWEVRGCFEACFEGKVLRSNRYKVKMYLNSIQRFSTKDRCKEPLRNFEEYSERSKVHKLVLKST